MLRICNTLLLGHCNSVYMNAPQCYVIPIMPFLFMLALQRALLLQDGGAEYLKFQFMRRIKPVPSSQRRFIDIQKRDRCLF